jgi:CHAT domain-containing protein
MLDIHPRRNKAVLTLLTLLPLTGISLTGAFRAHPAIAQSDPTEPPAAQKTATPPLNPGELIVKEEATWTKDYEQYFVRNFSTPLRNAPTIRAFLENITQQTGKRSAVIYLVPTPQKLELLLVTSGAEPIHLSFANAKGAEVKAIAKTFRQEVSNLDPVNPTRYLASSQQLYALFIAPIAEELKRQKIDTLLFCVGAGLRSIPFSALHDGKRFLVEQYSIGLIPAFSLIDLHYESIKKAKVLAMGASEFKDLSPLPSVPQELSAIVQGRGGNSFLNTQFTVENLQAQRQKELYPIVHLATHAKFQPGKVENSYLQFWEQKVSLNQLPKLQLKLPVVDLLVLSACQTALGDPQAELGFAGLAIQSGAKSVLGSLWNVSDAGTLQLMAQFYKQLKTSPTKAEALRKAQVEILKQKSLSHPYNWSAFTMIGSPW